MDALPNGDKYIRADISGLKIIIKPHIYLLVYYYFLNSFPIYEVTSADKPNFFQDDPENNTQMDFSIAIEDSLLCMLNKENEKTIACEGRIIL